MRFFLTVVVSDKSLLRCRIIFFLLLHLSTVIFRLQQVKGLSVLLGRAEERKPCNDISVIYQQEEIYTVIHL